MQAKTVHEFQIDDAEFKNFQKTRIGSIEVAQNKSRKSLQVNDTIKLRPTALADPPLWGQAKKIVHNTFTIKVFFELFGPFDCYD